MRKPALVAAAVVAALALTAPSASADAVGISDEATGDFCPALATPTPHTVTGGCPIHAVSTQNVSLLTEAGTLLSSCSNEFEAHVDAAGGVLVTSQVLSGAGCAIRACRDSESETLLWEGQVSELGAGGKELDITICLETVAAPHTQASCELEIDISEPSMHDYEFSATDVHCLNANGMEVKNSGVWELENSGGHPAIKVHKDEDEKLSGKLKPTPATLDFNDVKPPVTLSVEFQNLAGKTITLRGEQILSLGVIRFGTDGGCMKVKTLANNAKCTIKVTKNTAGADANSLEILFGAGKEPTYISAPAFLVK